MTKHSLSHLSDSTLEHDLRAAVSRERGVTAEVVAHIAEFDARKLYLAAAHPSMFAYCVGELRLSEQAAYKRILVARRARMVPGIFAALADGRVHLSGLVLLSPHLTPANAPELMAAATHKTKTEIEQLLARRFPLPDLPTRVRAIALPSAPAAELSPGMVQTAAKEPAEQEIGLETAGSQLSPGIVPTSPEQPPSQLSPGIVGTLARIEAEVPRPRLAPLSSERFALQVTIARSTHDKMRQLQDLLSHQVPYADLAQVLDRAFDALLREVERARFAATDRPRHGQPRSGAQSRHVPAEVKRTVWKRDGGQCTFVSVAGRRCSARSMLEFDHLQEFARGGRASVAGIRLRCRAHNQYGAECTYGTEFMRLKRQVRAT